MAQALPVRQEKPYEEPAPPSASDTVTIACSLPTGMQLYLEREVEISEAAGGGTKHRTEWRKYGEPVHIRGPRRHAQNDDPMSPISDGYALTFGVPREFAETWFKQNADIPAVQKRMIIMHDKRSELKAMTKEHAGQLTGMEPLRPGDDKRIPRGVTKLTGV